jgi:hypothetical protein
MAGVTLTEAQLLPKPESSTLDSADGKYTAKKLSEAANEVGWYVTNANDKEVAGPMSELKARVKARELGGDANGFAVSYVSDYDNLRANESTEINEAEDHYFFGRTSHDRFKSKAEEIHGPIAKGDRNSSGNTPYYDKAGKQIGHHSIDGEGDHTYRVYAKPSVKEATNTMQRYGQKIIQRAKEKAAAEKKLEAAKKSVKEATGSNTPYGDLADWKAAAAKAGLEVYSQGAADGKYTAKRDGEVYGRFNKESGEGWIHSSAIVEDANYDDEDEDVPEGPLPQGLAEIARHLGFKTLDTRNSDSLDFKEVSVGGVKSALLAAYNLGKTQATAQATPAEQQPQSGGLPVPQGRTSADHQQAGPVGIAR